MQTMKEQAISDRLGRPVVGYIADLRAQGFSYRQIADRMAEDTGDGTTVTHETIRSWDRTRWPR